MTNFRFKALESVLTRTIPEVKAPSPKISDYFGANVCFRKKTGQAQAERVTFIFRAADLPGAKPFR